MTRIRNKNTGAEISSPYLVRECNNYTKAEWYIDHKSNTGVFYLADGWEEVKEDNSLIEEAAKIYLTSNISPEGGDISPDPYIRVVGYTYEEAKQIFCDSAIWMRDNYLKEVGIDKVFDDWLKEKENK